LLSMTGDTRTTSDENPVLKTQLDEASIRKQQGNQDLIDCSAGKQT